MKILNFTISLFIVFAGSLCAQDFWQPLSGPYGGKVLDIAVKPDGNLYALKENNVFFSTNSGASWAPINKDFPYTNLSMAFSSSGILYVGKSSGGIWWTSDNGQTWDFNSVRVAQHSGTWSSVYTITVNSSGHIFISGYRSLNGGVTWLDMPVGSSFVKNFALNSSQHLYAATGQGVFKSTDNGGSWALTNNDIGNTNISIVRVGSDNTVYAGTQTSGIFKSVNNGANWTPVNSGLTDMQVVSLEVTAGKVYAGTKTGGIFVSDNGGASWTAINNGLMLNQVNAIKSFSGANLYTATNEGGLFRSLNNGGSWSEANQGMFVANLRDAAFKNPGNIFITGYGGIFRSLDNGATWSLKKGAPSFAAAKPHRQPFG